MCVISALGYIRLLQIVSSSGRMPSFTVAPSTILVYVVEECILDFILRVKRRKPKREDMLH
jgi:hypothetical protein